MELRVRLTPRSSRDEIVGIIDTPDGPAIEAKVRAIPANGAANNALVALAAKWLDIPKSSVELTLGAKSRNKTLRVTIMEPDDAARLQARLGTLTRG